MPYLNIWIHFVWATKNRAPLLTKNIRQDIFKHIKANYYTTFSVVRFFRTTGYLLL